MTFANRCRLFGVYTAAQHLRYTRGLKDVEGALCILRYSYIGRVRHEGWVAPNNGLWVPQ